MNSKTITRISSISGNAFRQLLVSAINMAIPFMVIHYSSKEIWGSFVSLLLYSLLALQVVNWGNKEFLLRKFSQQPNEIRRDYSGILLLRLPLLLPAVAIGLLYFPLSFGLYLLLWLLGRYLNQSAEALVIFEKKFNATLVIEIIAFAGFFGLFWYFRQHLDLFLLLVLYSGYQLIKGLAYFILFGKFFSLRGLKIDKAYFKLAFPFFLLSVMGFLISKADVYVINYFSNETITAEYQVINSLLVFVASASVYIYTPFTKNIYRNSAEVIKKTRWLTMLSGLAIIPVALVCIRFVIMWYLKLEFSFVFYVLCFAYVFPPFAYGIRVIEMFRRHEEKTVIWYLFLSACCNAFFSALFLFLGYEIMGALLGGVMAQMLAWYLFSRHQVDIRE